VAPPAAIITGVLGLIYDKRKVLAILTTLGAGAFAVFLYSRMLGFC
jgi:hypothetical protein